MIFTLFFIGVFSYRAWIVTDTHYDDLYTEGSASKCFTVDCCHADSVPREGTEDQLAGRCGNLNCYPPLDTVTSAYDYIADNAQSGDEVFFLMDVVPGDVLSQSMSINKDRITEQVDIMKKKLSGIAVYPVPGNHDYFLSSEWEYPPTCEWMLEHMAKQFKKWLPTDALNTFKKGGYYTLKLESGVRLISLNLVFVDAFNIYSKKYKETDPAGITAWFNATMKAAKEAGEKVIIISHEGVGLKGSGKNDLVAEFNADYDNIMNLYGDVVIAHFAGHSHEESFRVLPTAEKAKYGIILNPALTTWQNINPKFRLVEYDNNKVTDWTTFYLPIDDCNAASSGYPWKKLYKASEAYGLNDYSPAGLKKLYEKINSDSSAWATYTGYYSNAEQAACKSGKCKTELLCSQICLTEECFANCTA